MGLWAAVKADPLGIPTLLVDAGPTGSGASGGLLGALMPHTPDRWNDKKQFQFEALVSLEQEIARLEAETGLAAGYRRSGRLIPLPKPHLRDIALRNGEDAACRWVAGGRSFAWNVLETAPDARWVSGGFSEAGLVHETLSGRVSPRLLTAALAEYLRRSRWVRVAENHPVEWIDPVANRAYFANGESVAFGRCILSAGHGSFRLLQALAPRACRPLGRPVKGQAALLKADIDPAQPVIFLNGLYVVPHDDGTVAIGSTSEEEFSDAFATDGKLDDVLDRARRLVPALEDAPVVERWAGLRPKAVGREPMVGPHPDHPSIVALTGGFKVSFGLAHRLADAALAAVQGRPMDLLPSFTAAEHLRIAEAGCEPAGD
nr:FAD-binding oxidoreductase [Rhizobium sp. Q54]